MGCATSTVVAAYVACLALGVRAQSLDNSNLGQGGKGASVSERTGTGNATIRGRVIAADTAAPLPYAQVRLRGETLRVNHVSLTDEQGRYEFTELIPGRYILTASKSGYLTLAYGQRRPREAARPVAVDDGEVLQRMDVLLPKGSVIVARITDAFGGPLAGIQVQAQQYLFVEGQRRLSIVGMTSPRAETDDLGQVRLHGLLPGEYYVSATIRPGMSLPTRDKDRVYAPTFYPGTPFLQQAQRVAVGVGEEVTAAIALVAVRAARISGIVIGSNGAGISAPMSVQLRQTSTTSVFSVRTIQPSTDGTFSISNVFPGDYTIDVMPASFAEPSAEYARLPIRVDGEDLTGLVVTTTRRNTLHGRFVFDTGSPPQGLRPGMMQARPVATPDTIGLPAGRADWNDDWTFDITGIVGHHVLRLGPRLTEGWFLKAVILEGRDITDIPIDFNGGRDIRNLQVVVTQTVAGISGRVLDSRGSAVADSVVVVFPDDRDRWTPFSRHIATGRPDQNGQFKIMGLPSGRYLAVAVEYIENGEERDPNLLDRLAPYASRKTLQEGKPEVLDLKLITF